MDKFIPGIYNNFYYKILGYFWGITYGLKQASRSWNLRFDEAIKVFGFIKNEDEPCVYKKVSGSVIVFLVFYDDDILLIGNDIPALQNVKSWQGSCFSMKDLGDAAYILGIKIYRDRSKRYIGLSHSTYIEGSRPGLTS